MVALYPPFLGAALGTAVTRPFAKKRLAIIIAIAAFAIAVAAMPGSGISAKERALLAHLQSSLGISDADAAAIERELMSGGGAEPSPIVA